jgi:hypothetical protein
MPVNDEANIFIAPADVWLAPVGTPMPGDDEAFEAPWTKLGWLKEGLQIVLGKDIYEVIPDQFTAAVLVQVTGTTFIFRASLDEIILTNMPALYGLGSVQTQAPGAGQIGKDTFKVAAAVACPTEKAVAVEGLDHNGFYMRANMWRGVSTVEITLAMRKGEEMAIPAEFKALLQSSEAGQELGLIVRKTANETGP